jgi:hypothetical protein
MIVSLTLLVIVLRKKFESQRVGAALGAVRDGIALYGMPHPACLHCRAIRSICSINSICTISSIWIVSAT